MTGKTRLLAAYFALMLVWAPTMLVKAQSGGASIQGTVADSTGAVVPAANIVLLNNASGVTLRSITDGTGTYSFPSIPPGTYTLSVSKPGFASYKVEGFGVEVGQHATENASLNPGASASIEVTASGLTNLLDPTSNDLGTVITPQSVAQLPLNGRNYLDLGLLSGAVQQNAGASAGSVNQTGHAGVTQSINIAGNEPDYTQYVVNGLPVVASRAGNTSLNISANAIDQFEVHYGFFLPDLGPNPGIVDVVTKSGGNQIHGQVYEYVRTNQLEARNYFNINQTTGVPIPQGPFHQNQFGFDFGGPVLKDKLFYFASYEGFRQNQASIQTGYTPTAALFGGDFSTLGVNIYDPATFNPATGTRTQFTGNKIPMSRINPTSAALLAYYLPGSSLAATSGNVASTPLQILDSDQFMGRIDYNLNGKNQFFFQGNWINSPNTVPGLFPGQGQSYPLDTELVNVGWNWTLSPNKVNELRIGGIRDSVFDEGVQEPGLETKLGITGTDDVNGVPGISIANYTGFGTSTGLIGNKDNIYQIQDSFNWLLGNHQLKFGALISYLRTVQSSANANARGVFTFNDTYTAQIAPNGSGGYSTVSGTGNSFADFLLGDLTNAQSIGIPPTHVRWTNASPYFQDTWKVNSHLTANLGLGWFGTTVPNPSGPDKNLFHSFSFATGQSTFVALGQQNPEVYNMTFTNFAPRIGVSYEPPLKNTLLRAGWGIYYTTQEAVNIQYAIVSQFITINNSVANVQPNPSYVLGQNVLPPVPVGQITTAQAASITGPIQYLSANQHTPYVEQYTLDLQHTFGTAYLVDIAYIGNASHHLALNYDPIDCSSPNSNLCIDANNPYLGKYSYIQEVASIGNGNYNSLLIKFQRQFTNGISILANYNYSKALSSSQQGSNGTVNQRRFCGAGTLPSCDYGPTTFDVPQSFVISAVAQLPFGHGRAFLSHSNGVVNQIIGGWDTDVIANFQKGTPYNLTAPDNTAWTADVVRVDTRCNGRTHLANQNVRSNGHFWFDKTCYVDPSLDPINRTGPNNTLPNGARAAFGTTSFDSAYGPGINNWNIGVHKRIPIYKENVFTLRGEFFNAFNHAQFANPVSLVSSGSFGQILATQGQAPQREIQIGGTIDF